MRMEFDTVVDESQKRQERQYRQYKLENQRKVKEKQGLKAHFKSVSEEGVPFSHGVSTCKAELNKLCMALDPSGMDIQWQPQKDLELLEDCLAEIFGYSTSINMNHI